MISNKSGVAFITTFTSMLVITIIISLMAGFYIFIEDDIAEPITTELIQLGNETNISNVYLNKIQESKDERFITIPWDLIFILSLFIGFIYSITDAVVKEPRGPVSFLFFSSFTLIFYLFFISMVVMKVINWLYDEFIIKIFGDLSVAMPILNNFIEFWWAYFLVWFVFIALSNVFIGPFIRSKGLRI